MGAVLREQNALPYAIRKYTISSAKDDVNNVGAGRAAKGASPASNSKKAVSMRYGFLITFKLTQGPRRKHKGRRADIVNHARRE